MRWRPFSGDLGEIYRRFGPRRRGRNPLVLLVLVLVRWRREIVLAAGCWWGLHALAVSTHPLAAAAVALAALVGMFGWEPGRRAVTHRARAWLTEHQLRAGMIEAGILTWSGRLPAILAARPVTRGVRLLVHCPPGLSITAFQVNRDLLAAACWAVAVEVQRHPSRANLVHVLVVTGPEGHR